MKCRSWQCRTFEALHGLTHNISTMSCLPPWILLQGLIHRYRHQQKMNKTINDSKAAILEAHNATYVIKIDNPVKQPSELAARECFIKLEHTCCEFGLHIRNVDWAKKKIKILTYWRSWRHWWLLEHITRVRSGLEIASASSGLVTWVILSAMDIWSQS